MPIIEDQAIGVLTLHDTIEIHICGFMKDIVSKPIYVVETESAEAHSGYQSSPIYLACSVGIICALFFMHDEWGEGFSELVTWATFVECSLMVLGPALFAYVFAQRVQMKSSLLERELTLSHKEHILHLGHLTASIAHEVRNPIHNLRLITERLKSTNIDQVERSRMHQRLLANLDRVQHTIEIIYQQAQQSEVTTMEDIQLYSVINDITKQLLGVFNITCDTQIVVHAQYDALHIILSNLLRNARGADPDIIPISVTVDRTQAYIHIINTGNFNSSNQNTQKPGLGIGLLISKILIKRCHGALSIYQLDNTVETKLTIPLTRTNTTR